MDFISKRIHNMHSLFLLWDVFIHYEPLYGDFLKVMMGLFLWFFLSLLLLAPAVCNQPLKVYHEEVSSISKYNFWIRKASCGKVKSTVGADCGILKGITQHFFDGNMSHWFGCGDLKSQALLIIKSTQVPGLKICSEEWNNETQS